jgi:hypothetical protein
VSPSGRYLIVPPDSLAHFATLGTLVSSVHPTMRDIYVVGLLKALDMEPGQSFQPDARLQHILTCIAETGRALAAAVAYYTPERQWQKRQ